MKLNWKVYLAIGGVYLGYRLYKLYQLGEKVEYTPIGVSFVRGSTLFDSVGLTNSGKADLYPSLRFNPDTARLDMVQENPLVSFAKNTVPQSEILLTMFEKMLCVIHKDSTAL